jgi:hypothetical protein
MKQIFCTLFVLLALSRFPRTFSLALINLNIANSSWRFRVGMTVVDIGIPESKIYKTIYRAKKEAF